MQRRVFALTLIGIFLSVPGALARSDERNRSVDRESDIKRTYAIVSQLPPKQRRVLFRTLPSQVRAQLWVVHLQQFSSNHAELDANQRAIVNAAIAIAQSVLDDVNGSESPDLREIAARLEVSARLGFSHDLLGEAFYDLGPSADPAPVTSGRSIGRTTNMAFDSDPEVRDDCACSRDHDWCSDGDHCSAGCNPVPIGCGFMWWFACDGLCKQ